MRDLALEIQGLPPMNTASSRGSHWAFAKLKKSWENRVIVAVLEALGRWPAKPLEHARVTITRCSAAASEPDYDNLVQGGKFLLDGLVKAGVLADDKPAVIGQPVYLWERAKQAEGCVRIRVEEIAGVVDHRDAWERGPVDITGGIA